jgi:putative acetyltransferase
MIHIREATISDTDQVRDIHLQAFPETERLAVSSLAVKLLNLKSNPQTYSLIAETDTVSLGHVAFSPATITNNSTWQGYILAPLGVKPSYQGQKIGTKLIEFGVKLLSQLRVNTIFVYGDPLLYGRFGFNPEAAAPYLPPHPLQYPFGWQALTIQECAKPDVPAVITCVEPLNDPELW